MNQLTYRDKINRRNFVKFLAIGGAAAVGGYVISQYTPWINYNLKAEETWSPAELTGDSTTIMQALVHYATLAANSHNSQPWKFAISENVIEIHPDPSRSLVVVDPDLREKWISLGCALENLLVASRAAGLAAEVAYPGHTDLIQVRLFADSLQASPLFDAILLRQNTRTEFDGQPIPGADHDQIQSLPLEPGVSLKWLTTASEKEMALEYVNQGSLIQYSDPAFIDELISWIRFNKKEVMASLDGLYTVCTGNPEVPRWLGKMFVTGTKPQQQAAADTKKLQSASGAVVITSETDDKASWVRTGQVYERLALKMTSLNIKSALLNQPIELPQIRSQFQNALGIGTAMPQLLIRFGYAKSCQRSLRRSVDSVLF